jgi:hypothetical protein
VPTSTNGMSYKQTKPHIGRQAAIHTAMFPVWFPLSYATSVVMGYNIRSTTRSSQRFILKPITNQKHPRVRASDARLTNLDFAAKSSLPLKQINLRSEPANAPLTSDCVCTIYVNRIPILKRARNISKLYFSAMQFAKQSFCDNHQIRLSKTKLHHHPYLRLVTRPSSPLTAI